MFVPLERLQQDLELEGRVNTLLVVGPPADPSSPQDAPRHRCSSSWSRSARHSRTAGLTSASCPSELAGVGASVGARIEPAAEAAFRPALAVEASGGLLDRRAPAVAEQAAAAVSMTTQPVLTYLANTMRSGDREVPYSLVTAIDLQTIVPGAASAAGRSSAVPSDSPRRRRSCSTTGPRAIWRCRPAIR